MTSFQIKYSLYSSVIRCKEQRLLQKAFNEALWRTYDPQTREKYEQAHRPLFPELGSQFTDQPPQESTYSPEVRSILLDLISKI